MNIMVVFFFFFLFCFVFVFVFILFVFFKSPEQIKPKPRIYYVFSAVTVLLPDTEFWYVNI